jgi:hypothetical protein
VTLDTFHPVIPEMVVNEEQLLNIPVIDITFDTPVHEDIFRDVNEVHPKNISVKSVAFIRDHPDKLRVVNAVQPENIELISVVFEIFHAVKFKLVIEVQFLNILEVEYTFVIVHPETSVIFDKLLQSEKALFK